VSRRSQQVAEVKRLFRWALILVPVTVAAFLSATGCLYVSADVSTVGELRFTQRLAIPPLLAPDVDDEGRKVFELELQAGASTLLPGKTTATWGARSLADR
jgi:blue copper oxidase